MSKLREIVIEDQVFTIHDEPMEGEMEWVQEKVENDKRLQTQGEYDEPGIEINLVLRDSQGGVQGGVIASTVCKVMHLEVLWVAEQYRRQGYGSQLVLGAEQIGLENGCNTCQTWTFSFQGPNFYPTIGYAHLGVYDGYPNGVTEHVFMKRLGENHSSKWEFGVPDSRGFYLDTNLSEEDTKTLHDGLHRAVVQHVGDGYKGFRIKLVVKDREGELIGGLSAWTTLNNLIFDHIWIEERYRGIGLGSALMQEMEGIARENGCIASQAYCFSFQAIGFFEKMRYRILGTSDGYPPPIKEYYLIKKYNQEQSPHGKEI